MKKAIEIQAPNELKPKKGFVSVFLAGSIEMGKAEEWQQEVIDGLENEPIIFLNPRRDDWDSSWEQTKESKEFKLQVTWELTALEFADAIVMYFDPATKSPISLLELGLHARPKKMIVFYPKGFWKKGNVDITCDRYNVTQVDSFKGLISALKKLV